MSKVLRPRPSRFRTFTTSVLAAGSFTLLFCSAQPTADAQLPVTDVGAIAHLATTEINNYLRHIEDIAKYINMIDNQIEMLIRIGDPNTYIGMLQLNRLTNDLNQISQGIGRGIAEVQQAANGLNALSYTANGIYRNLQQVTDRFGRPVAYNVQAFAQFDTIGQLATQYQTDLKQYNTTMLSLGAQLKALMNSLNSAGSQVETAKITAQIHAVTGQIAAAGQIVHASADRFQVQSQLNNQMAARDAQAQQQLQAQEAQTEATSLLNHLRNEFPSQ